MGAFHPPAACYIYPASPSYSRRNVTPARSQPTRIRCSNRPTSPSVSYTNIQNYEEYFAVRREYFTKFNPASTGVQVAALAFEDLLLEVEAIAYLPDEA